MKYLHTMIRVKNPEDSISFFCDALGLKEMYRKENEAGRYTLFFLAAPNDIENSASNIPMIELTHNWDDEELNSGRNFGHLAFQVDDIYQTCSKLMEAGIEINRPPRDGRMAFVKSPDGISIELLQNGDPLEIKEPWVDMPNSGSW